MKIRNFDPRKDHLVNSETLEKYVDHRVLMEVRPNRMWEGELKKTSEGYCFVDFLHIKRIPITHGSKIGLEDDNGVIKSYIFINDSD